MCSSDLNAAGEDIDIAGATIVRDGYGTLTVLSAADEGGEDGDGLLDSDTDTSATLTYGAAAQLINRLMKDSGVEGYNADIIGADDEATQALSALQSVAELAELLTDASAEASLDGEAFDALLSAALNTDELTGIGEYSPNSGTMTVQDAYDTILDVVLLARNGMTVTGDTNKFL